MEDQADCPKEEATGWPKKAKTRKWPEARGRATLVASYTGVKKTVLSIIKSFKSGKVAFLNQRKIALKCSPTSYKIFKGQQRDRW